MSYDYRTDGITQSLLSNFLSCREQCKLYLKGYVYEKTSPALIYGTVFHGILELVYTDISNGRIIKIPNSDILKRYTIKFEKLWMKDNPKPDIESLKTLQISLALAENLLPHYFKFWWKKDTTKIQWKALEKEFKIAYRTSTGLKTYLRGKMDGVFNSPKLYLFETKTKSKISEWNLIDMLSFDFQVMFYVFVLKKLYKQTPKGVLYNIIRKPLSDIHRNESLIQYAKRIEKDVSLRPEFYFMRYDIFISPESQRKFCLEIDGLITDFILWAQGRGNHYKNTANCENKYGRCKYLQICSYSDYTKYKKRPVLFSELENK